MNVKLSLTVSSVSGIDGKITFDRAVPTGDGTYLEHRTVDVDAIDPLEALEGRSHKTPPDQTERRYTCASL